jgi:hypothetical protein
MKLMARLEYILEILFITEFRKILPPCLPSKESLYQLIHVDLKHEPLLWRRFQMQYIWKKSVRKVFESKNDEMVYIGHIKIYEITKGWDYG